MTELRTAPDATLADDSLFPVAEPTAEGTGVRKATGAQLKEYFGGAAFPPFTDNAGKALLVNEDEDGVLWGTVASGGGGGDDSLGGNVNPALEIFPALINGATAFGSGFSALKASKIGRVVTLNGMVKVAPNTVMAVLPVGWRPAESSTFPSNVGNSFGNVDVLSNGQVQVGGGNSATFVAVNAVFIVPEADAYDPIVGMAHTERDTGHYRKLASLDLSGKTNVSFDNIPQDGQGLRLVVSGCMTTGGGNLNVRINNNTQGIYDTQRIFANRGVDANTAQDDWQGEDAWRRLSTFGTGGATSFAELEILNYTDTANPKSAKGSGRQPSTASRAYYLLWGTQARTNDAVTSVQVGNDEGVTFAPGSRATLYVVGSEGLQPEQGIPAEYGGDAMSGWRRTADGWLEQWGQVSGNTDVVFPKPYDTVYTLQGNCSGFLDDVGGYNGTFNYHSLTNLGFKARPRATTNGNAFTPGEPFKWRAVGRVAARGVGDGAPAKYRIGGFFAATPSANEVVLLHVAAEDVALPALFQGSRCNIDTAPSADAVFAVRRNGATIGTMTLKADKSVVFTTDGVLVAAGDVISVVAPADSLGAANVAFTFKAV